MCVLDGVRTMWTLERFALCDFDQLLRYRGVVKSILEWGSERCKAIVEALEQSGNEPDSTIAAKIGYQEARTTSFLEWYI